MTTYTVDTNVIIHLDDRYPRDIFPSVWDSFEALIQAGRACICTEVKVELSIGTTCRMWAESQPSFICSPKAGEYAQAGVISQRFPNWVRQNKNYADPFVIAHAIQDGHDIVTNENRAGANVPNSKQKIPNVANLYNIQTMTLIELARAEGWQF